MNISWNSETKKIALYILKCATGCALVFLLSNIFPYVDMAWFLISVMLVLSPDSAEAVKLALTRIYANIAGGSASLFCLLIMPINVFTICVAISITIVLCYWLKIMDGVKSAIAAAIIIMLHDMNYGDIHFWDATLQRILSVLAGCALGLLITLIFHQQLKLKKDEVTKKQEEA